MVPAARSPGGRRVSRTELGTEVLLKRPCGSGFVEPFASKPIPCECCAAPGAVQVCDKTAAVTLPLLSRRCKTGPGTESGTLNGGNVFLFFENTVSKLLS